MTRPAKLMGTENMHMHDFRRGSRTARSLGILAATITLVAARHASADLMLDFANDRPDATPAPGVPAVPAYITFTGSGAFDATADIDGVEEPAHALADIEPTVAAGRSLVDRADAISESLLHIRHLPFPLRKGVCRGGRSISRRHRDPPLNNLLRKAATIILREDELESLIA
jgi:hypothetical protein